MRPRSAEPSDPMVDAARLRGGPDRREDLVEDLVPGEAARRRDQVLPLDPHQPGLRELDEQRAGEAIGQAQGRRHQNRPFLVVEAEKEQLLGQVEPSVHNATPISG